MSNPAEIEAARKDELVIKIASGDLDGADRLLEELHPADIAEVIEALEGLDEKLRLFALLDAERSSEVIRELGEDSRTALLENLGDGRVSAIIEHLDTDDATDLLAKLSEERQVKLLRRTSPETRRDVEGLLAYPEDSAGGIMKTEVAAVPADATVAEVTEYLRKNAEQFHDIHNVFVTDDKGTLVGLVPLRRLILASDFTPVSRIMETDVVSVRADVDQEEVAHLFEKYDLVSLPVVDSLGCLVGRITIDDVVDVIEEEATEDILRLAGVAGESVAVTNSAEGIRSRLPWLALNLLTAAAGAFTISLFERTIQAMAVAAALMTIVASQGGAAGVQTMTLIVRGLALGEVRTAQVLRILGKQLLVAAANGSALGLVSGAAVYLWRHDPRLSVIFGVALLANHIIAVTIGTLVPLGLKLLRVDPAVSSNVFVTASTDLLGFFIFLALLSSFV
ncbi:MAG: magnesium transporter [Deltaproteobacteria bacterium]|nr:MAG: magnesium transporter [Deltaproteobacteria bacterium]